jgi:UDP-GlcNAc:undecaprenyl-phosphate GlcNAc-1-phosphate transferase
MNELLLQSLALPATAALIVFFRRRAPQLGLVDVPGGRKQHHGEVPLVGGLGMFGGLVVVALAAGGWLTTHAALLAAMSLVMLVGFVDDRNGLSPRVRFLVQAVAVLIMVYWGGVRLDNLGNLFGFGDVILGRWSVPMTVFAVLGVINAMNMIDGADGLASGLALIALLFFAAFAGVAGVLGDTLLLPLGFAVAGFMAFNLRTPWRNRASVFMGDAGSMMLGFALAWYAVDLASVRHAMTPITAVWILAIPLMDTISLMIRRVLKGVSPFCADCEHLHHILQRAGFSHGQTVFIVHCLALLLAGIGVAGWKLGVPEYVMFYAFMAVFAVYTWGVLHAWKLMKRVRKLHDAVEHHAHHEAGQAREAS